MTILRWFFVFCFSCALFALFFAICVRFFVGFDDVPNDGAMAALMGGSLVATILVQVAWYRLLPRSNPIGLPRSVLAVALYLCVLFWFAHMFGQ